MTKTRWVVRETDANLPLMAKTLNIHEITARCMANRGIRSKKTALAFLSPIVDKLRDPFTLKGMHEAVQRIFAAIGQEKIMIYGDYDADGIMSTVILYKTLQKLGADCDYYIPHRVDEGYGMNQPAVTKLASAGVNLLIAVDNGISAVQEVAAATALGMDTVIIDHHEPGETLPAAVAIVDPKQPDCEFPFKEMCAAGLTYKLCDALCSFAKNPLTNNERDEMLMLAGIATLCDIVDLSDENRIIVSAGLAALNANKLLNPGLGSLITVRGYLAKPIDATSVGFVIGPCLNATGRLKSASLAVELLMAGADETKKRLELAQELTELNDARKALTSECVERAMAGIFSEGVNVAGTSSRNSDGTSPENSAVVSGKDNDNKLTLLPKVLVLTDFEAHESVAGIVAGRVREMTNHPTILLTRGDSAAKGSGRSIEAYNMFEALYAHRHLFHKFGGHAMAAGLTLPEENIEALRLALNNDCTLTDEDFRPILQADCELPPQEISLAISQELACLAPFGKGNSEPLFISYGLFAEKVRIMDEKNTLIFTFLLKGGRRLKGIAFGLNEQYAAAFAGKPASIDVDMDVAYNIETNVWNDVAEVQIRIRDFSVHM